MPTLKVGIHEWIVVHWTERNTITLWTDGLVGCVGVAIITPTRAFITHINSELTAENWKGTVEKEFSDAISGIEDIGDAIECVIVGGENLALFNTVLDPIYDIVNEKTDDKCKISYAERKPGVVAYLVDGKPRAQAINRAEEGPSMDGALNSNNGGGYIESRGFFSCAKGSVATVRG